MSVFNKEEIWDFVKLVVVSLLIIIPVRLYIAQPFMVRGASMDPTFANGDYLIIDEISYRFQDPKRGEVVVFRYPLDRSKFFIKRIIGLPQETVRVENNLITIFNDANEEGQVLNEDYTQGVTIPNTTIILDDDEYYVLGDNRPFSSDSRTWGTLPKDLIIGRSLVRLWPITSISFWPGSN